MTNVSFPDSKIITLRVPVVIGDADNPVTYDKIELREPFAYELEDADNSMVALISIVAKIPLSAAKKIRSRDYKDACTYLNYFL